MENFVKIQKITFLIKTFSLIVSVDFDVTFCLESIGLKLGNINT